MAAVGARAKERTGVDGCFSVVTMAESTPAPITAADVPASLLRACPSFAEPWEAVREEYADADNPGGRLGYLDAGAFIRHLVSLKIANTLEEFPAVFDLIERLVVDGDEYVSNLAVIGYLEGFQMCTVTDRGLDPEADFAPWLRPTSRAYWEAICRFWEDGTTVPYIPPIQSGQAPGAR